MPKFKVVWEVSKSAIVEAKDKEEAIERVMNGEIEGKEDEVLTSPDAYLEDQFLAHAPCFKGQKVKIK